MKLYRIMRGAGCVRRVRAESPGEALLIFAQRYRPAIRGWLCGDSTLNFEDGVTVTAEEV